MAAGDLKGEECLAIEVTAGATVVKGDLVHLESDGKWDPTASADTGKFGVAMSGGADTEAIMVCIYGRVEVTATAAAIAKGAYVIADAAKVVDAGTISETTVYGTIVGTAMEAFGSGETKTVFVGMM